MNPAALPPLVLPAVIGLLVSVLLTPLVGRLAERLGIVAKPRKDRWAGRPVPMLGGVAIYIAAASGLLIGADSMSTPTVGLLLGGLFLLVVGALDDKYAFRPQTKLTLQVLGACIVTGFGVGFKLRPVEFFNVLLSIFWIVAIINAINLMDNMDGLAPGVSLIAAASLAFQLSGTDMPARAAMSAALAGALGGFLIFNFPPARIFMGDAGSLSVGVMLAGLSLSNSLFAEQKLGALSVLLGPALVLAVPLLDVLLVSVTRILRGQPISQGGRDHSSHRLIRMGLSERKALVVFYVLAAVAGLLGSQLAQGMSLWRSVIIVPLSWIPLGLFFAWLAKVRVVADVGRPDGRMALIVGWVFKRRMLEVVMDLSLAFVCLCLAYLIRFDFTFEAIYRNQVVASAPWVIGLTLASLNASGVYGGHWEHYGVGDVFRLAKGVGTAVLCCIAVAVVLHRFEHFPRSIFPLYGGVLFVGLMAVRASFQFFDLYLAEQPAARSLIVGVGPEARTALAHLAGVAGKSSVAGFVDPNSTGSISQLKGLPVFRLDELEGLGSECAHHRLILAESQISLEHLALLKEHSTKTGKQLQRFEVRCSDI